MIGFSRAAGPDMLFAGLITAAMAVAVVMLQKEHPGAFLRIAFGFFLGAAVLAKGPAAVILAGGMTLVWAAISRNWVAPFRFLHPLVVAVFCLTALPWYVLCALRNPDFLCVFIWQHNFERYTTPLFEHRQPVWFYAYILLLAVLPWIAFFFGALFRAAIRLRQKTAIESVDLFFVCWAVFPILFFSFSQSKLPSYILPAIPPFFLLLGRSVSKSIQGNGKAAIRALAWTGVALLLTAAAFAATRMRTAYIPSKDIRVELLIFILGAAVAALAFKKRAMAGFAVMALTVVAAVEIANFVVLPEIDSAVSNRRLATKLLQDGASHGDLSLYRVSRETEYGLNYYLDRKIPIWVPGKSEPEWILGCPPMDTQIANQYEIVDDNPLDTYIPISSSLCRRKQRAQ
jgi:4-amino-4-deoxy-L-arabinose transferase-like glycosyltransferase